MEFVGTIGPTWPGVVDELLEVGGRAVRILRAPAQPGAEDVTPVRPIVESPRLATLVPPVGVEPTLNRF